MVSRILELTKIGIQQGIKYTWAFMLLGQMVSISFATNLLFLTLLISQRTSSSPAWSPAKQQTWLGPWVLNLGGILGTSIPAFMLASEHYWHHPTDFVPVILTPHIALLVLPACRAILPARILGVEDRQVKDKAYSFMWTLTLCNAALMLCKTTWTAYSYAGFTGIQNALLEHPATSSIAFNVILCWTSWAFWLSIQRGQMFAGVRKGSMEDAKMLEDDYTGIAIDSKDSDDTIRRR